MKHRHLVRPWALANKLSSVRYIQNMTCWTTWYMALRKLVSVNGDTHNGEDTHKCFCVSLSSCPPLSVLISFPSPRVLCRGILALHILPQKKKEQKNKQSGVRYLFYLPGRYQQTHVSNPNTPSERFLVVIFYSLNYCTHKSLQCFTTRSPFELPSRKYTPLISCEPKI